MTTPIIETVGLSKKYQVGTQAVNALSDFTVEINTGDFVAIMGPSGSGKSTCMHLLGCLQSPSTGKYKFDGVDAAALDADALAEIRNAKIGFVFQSFHLLPRATALHNVELPLLYAGTKYQERRSKAEQALCAVGLQNQMEYRPNQLSGGQMQRVAIARALVNKPQLILTDEPTGALDSQTSVEIMELLAQLNATGITIVVVTHNEEVARYARRILRFRDGRVIADEAQQ